MTIERDNIGMQQALALAKKAELSGEVPVGAVVIHLNKTQQLEVIGSGFNQQISKNDPTAHAEILALRSAAQYMNNYRLQNCILYSTIEPCTMCLGALVHARIERLVFGATEPRSGAICSNSSILDSDYFNHTFTVTTGVMATECALIMRQFFQKKR